MLEEFCPTAFSSYEDFWKNFKVTPPADFNFAYDVVDAAAAHTPGRTAMVWCNDAGEERSFSFADMRDMSARAGNFFRKAGVRKGDPVMLILKRRYEFWFCLLALHRIGAIAIPATHLLTTKDVIYRNKAADIRMIVSVNDPVVIAHIEEAVRDSPSLKSKVLVGGKRAGWLDFDAEVPGQAAEFPRPTGADRTTNTDISILYFTSGTTGYPKMVQHDFNYPLGHIVTARFWQNIGDDCLHLTLADTGWAKAMWGKIYGQWLAGGAVMTYDMDRFVPGRLLEVMARHKVTGFCAPPTVFRYLIKEDLKRHDLSALRWCTIAGEPLNPEVYQRFLELTGIRLMEGYGQTEMTLAVATFPWMTPKPGSMGRPSPGYDLDVIDTDGKSCETGETGEIVIRLDRMRPLGMYRGYFRDEELTARAFAGGVYHTGDTAWRDEDGYYWFVGRTDDMIKSSGYRIGPFEVESAMLEHPAVLECAVTGVPDPDRGLAVKASVVLAKGYTPSEDLVRELQEHVKKVTAPYKYPRVIEFVAELPKTISGKIRRVEIRGKDGVDQGSQSRK